MRDGYSEDEKLICGVCGEEFPELQEMTIDDDGQLVCESCLEERHRADEWSGPEKTDCRILDFHVALWFYVQINIVLDWETQNCPC